MTLKNLLLAVGSAASALVAQGAVALAQNSGTIDSVVLESGNPGETLSSGYNTLETAKITCPYSVGCTFSMRIMSSISQATCHGEWSIVGLIDGQSVDGGPTQDVLPASGITDTRVWEGQARVKSGTHTLEFQLDVPCEVTANQWSVRYVYLDPTGS